MEERRRAHRIPVDLRVVIHFDDADDIATSRVADVSLNGVFIRTEHTAPVGTIVFLDLDVGEETIAIDGKVVRVAGEDAEGGPGIGVEYTAIGEQARRRLIELIR